MTIIERVNQEMKEAMRNRNQLKLDVLRMLKSKILAADARATLPDAEVIKLFKTYYGNIQEAYVQAKDANRTDISDRLKSELAIIEEFLPKAPSMEETKKLVAEAIAISGAKTKRDLGLVMKSLKQLNSAVDGKLASELASKMLGD